MPSSLYQELMGTTCRCGQPKDSKKTFCSKCYFTLHPVMRMSLYQRMGDGYEEAYAKATKFLDSALKSKRVQGDGRLDRDAGHDRSKLSGHGGTNPEGD